MDPPSAQDLPPGGKLRLFDEQDNNKRIRHLSKLPDFEERGLDEHDLVEVCLDMQQVWLYDLQLSCQLVQWCTHLIALLHMLDLVYLQI